MIATKQKFLVLNVSPLTIHNDANVKNEASSDGHINRENEKTSLSEDLKKKSHFIRSSCLRL